MALLALHRGLRAKEIFTLIWDKVNLKKQEITLVDTKNGKSRTGYLTDEATAILRKRSINCSHPRIIFPVIKKTVMLNSENKSRQPFPEPLRNSD